MPIAQTASTSAPLTAVPAGEWHVDPVRSRVEFHTRAMAGLFPVLGRFERFAGDLHVDDEGEASGRLTIEAESIDTGIAKRDAHLRTADFFHAALHPEMTFVLDEARPDADGRLELAGTLAIRHATIPIRASATVTREAEDELALHARFPVDHHAAGLGWARAGMVRKVMDADVSLVLTRTP